MSPRPSLATERKPQILRAAVRVISVRGLEGTRLVDVAEEAGLSVGAVQHYFGTRERLISEAFAFESERAATRWLNAADGHRDAWDQLVALIDSVLGERSEARWARWLEFWAAASRDVSLRPEMRQAYEYWRAPIRRAIETGTEAGVFGPRDSLDAVVDRAVAVFDGLALQVLLDGMPLERMRDLLLTGLAAELGVEADPIRARRAAARGGAPRASRRRARS
jgi:AcrR family transcriptional regulator